MRRAEKAIIDREEIYEILAGAEVGRLGTCRDGVPYVTPVNFAHREGRIYFHSALEGRKIDNIRANPVVCFEVDEPLGTVVTGESACEVSYAYRSVIVQGEARLVEDDAEKIEALRLLLKKFEPDKTDGEFSALILRKTAIVEIEIKKMYGKQSFPVGARG